VADFVGKPYTCKHNSKGNRIEITLSRSGHFIRSGVSFPINLTKTFCFETVTGQLTARYKLTNESSQNLDLHFGVELGFGSYTFPMRESEITHSLGKVIDATMPTEHTDLNDLRLDSRLYQFRTALNFDKICQSLGAPALDSFVVRRWI